MMLLHIEGAAHDAAITQSNPCFRLSLFVVAKSKTQAVRLWRDYFSLPTKCKAGRIFFIPVAVTGAPRALGWHTLGGVVEI